MTKDTDITTQGRRDRLIKEQVHDPYMTRRKPPEPTVCPECGVVFQQGRWQWSAAVRGGTHEELCPACQRIRDKVPAGILSLSGAFLEDHQEEIINLVRNKVDSEKAQHPMKRLMNIEPHAGGMVITFTDTHLPRVVGEAIQRAYEGELEIQYTEEAGIVRVNWSR